MLRDRMTIEQVLNLKGKEGIEVLIDVLCDGDLSTKQSLKKEAKSE